MIIFSVVTVPSAPQNLTANRVTSEEIHLSWAPPLTTYQVPLKPSDPKPPTTTERDLSVIAKNEPQADSPMNYVIENPDIISDTSNQNFDFNWYKNDKQKYDDIIIDRSKREVRSHRHRKRRQENATETKSSHVEKVDDIETHVAIDMPVKKSLPVVPLKDPTQIAYVLYYEQGVPRYDSTTVIDVPSSADVKKKNVFPSDLGMEQYSRATKNLTLLNTSGVLTKVVGFRLKNLSKLCC